jgi:hypothetical protein
MLIKDIFAGYSARIRLENSLQLQKAKHTRPPQIKLEIAATLNGIATELRNDAQLKEQYDKINLEVPA